MTKQIVGGEYFQVDDLEIIVSTDGSKVWINIDGFLTFRAYRVSRLSLRDDRTPGTRADDGNATAIAEPSGEATSRLASPPSFECKAKPWIKLDPPQECNWPVCGCDPYATKVIAALQEHGIL